MDPVKLYRERFWSLWTDLKKIFRSESSCNHDCNQGRDCTCRPVNIGDTIIGLHDLARTIDDHEESYKVRLLADELAKIGNRLHEKNLEFRNPDSGLEK